MSQRSTDSSFIWYHSPSLACKEKRRYLEMDGTASAQNTGQKLPNQECSRTNPIQPLRKPSPLKYLTVSNTARKVGFPQDTFFPCSEGSHFSPLCSRSSVLHGSCHLRAPGRRTGSRGAVLRLPETCRGEDPGTGDTPQPTERPGGLSNDPGTLQDAAFQC